MSSSPRLPLLSDSDLLNILSLSHNATAIYTSEDLIIQSANDAMLAFWGKDKTVIGKPLVEAVPLKDNPLLQLLKNVWRTGISYEANDVPADLRLNGKQESVYIDLQYRAIKNHSGEMYCILHTAKDVTDRALKATQVKTLEIKTLELNEELAASNEELTTMNEELTAMNEELNAAAEEQQAVNDALIIAEQKARLVINDAPVAIGMLKGQQLLIESANTELLNLWGQDGDVVGKPFAEILPQNTKKALLEILNNVYTTGVVFYGDEVKSQQESVKGIEEVYFNFVYHPIKDDGGQTVSIMIVASEVTEQIQARKKIEHSERRLHQMITASPVGMTILRSRQLLIENANAPMLKIWTRTHEDVIGKHLLEVFPELLDQQFHELLYSVFDTGKAISIPEALITIAQTNGTANQLYINLSYEPLFDLDGKVESIIATVTDITEIVTTRKNIEDSQAALQTVNKKLAATNEEFEAINEEFAATNEELAVANEEYTVLNEELISTNEELALTNNEIVKAKNTLDLAIDAAGLIIWTAQLGTDEFLISENGEALFEKAENGSLTLAAFLERVTDQHRDKLKKGISTAIETKSRLDQEFQIKATDLQKLRWFKLNAIPYYDEDGQPSYLSGTMLDVTEQKEDDQRKNDFIAMVSHELKTPLTSLKAYVQMVSLKVRNSDDGFIVKTLDKANSQVNRMTGLINGFLNLSRLESGKISLNKQTFDLEELVKELVDETALTATGHEVVFKPTGTLIVNADADKIGSVITNLLSNAIKYSPKNTCITVACQIVNNQAQLSVKDEGMGISPKDMERLFERFYRVEGEQTETISGFGIGLYLSAEIMQRHNGKLWVESEPGKGSIFYFTLPL